MRSQATRHIRGQVRRHGMGQLLALFFMLAWPQHSGLSKPSKAGKPAEKTNSSTETKTNKASKSGAAANARVAVPAVNIPADEVRKHAQAMATLREQPGLTEDERAQRTRQYIAEQLYETGLLPGGDGQHGIAGLSQALSLVSIRSQLPSAPLFRSTATTIPVKIAVGSREVVLFSGTPRAEVALKDSELVFVGYGVTAPESAWDDYKGTDLQGKVALMLDGNPGPSDAGKSQTLAASRWPLKFAEALRRGATGALIIHHPQRSAESLARLRSYFGGERLLGAPAAGNPTLQVGGFISDEAARRLLLAAGLDLEKQQQAANDRDFTPSALRVRMSVTLQNQVRSVESANVVGILPGTDESLRQEAVVLTSHIDQQASKADAEQASGLVNLPGVRDRVVGAAGLLAMARATRQLPPPKRSLIFAFVSGHGESFAGAQHLLKHLPQPAERVVAHVNIDGLNVGDSQPEILQLGRGRSTLDEVLDSLATSQKRAVIGETPSQRGLFYRSESLVFARAGIPVLFLATPDLDRYLATDYLQPSDTFHNGWSFAGGAQDCALLYQVALWVANARTPPRFLATDEFAGRASNENPAGK